MFCTKCGTQLPDDAGFCTNCGAALGGQASVATQVAPAPAPVAAPAPGNDAFNKYIKTLLATVKGVFSKDAESTIAAGVKSNSLEWITWFSVLLVMYTLSGALPGAKYDMFGTLFGYSLLAGLISIAAIAFGLLGAAKLMAQVPVTLFGAFNMVGRVFMPLAACYLVAIPLHFIWAPLASVLLSVASLWALVLLYNGFRELAGAKDSAWFPFALVLAAVIVVEAVFGALLGEMFEEAMYFSAVSAFL